VHECRKLGIEVLPPDINESDVRFTVVNGKIRFGLAAVKMSVRMQSGQLLMKGI